MKKLAKNFSLIIFSIIFTMTCICLPAAAKVSHVSDVQNKSVSILGNIGDKGGIPYTVNIFPYSEGDSVPGDASELMDSRLYTTYKDGTIGKDETKGETIYFAGSFPAGHYSMYIHYLDGDTKTYEKLSFFIIDENDGATKRLLETLNDSDTGKTEFVSLLSDSDNLAKIGILKADIETSGNYPYEHAYAVKSGAYTVAALQQKVLEGDVIYVLKNEGVVAVERNIQLLGDSYNTEWKNLNDAEKAQLDKLLKNTDYTDDTLIDIFAEKVLAAKVTACSNIKDLRDVIEDNEDTLGADMSKGSRYDKIPDAKKYLVFEYMLSKLDELETTEEIADAFDDGVKYAEKKADSQSGGNGGGPSGGNYGSQSSTGDILNPDKIPAPDNSNTGNNGGSSVFTDIGGHFAESYIINMASKGIISGFGDGTYRPNGYITRAEFAKLISAAFGINGGDATFGDVNNEWFAPYVKALASKGIITGYDGLYHPNDNIKREDAVVIMQRVIELYSINADASANVQYGDADSVSPYAKDAVDTLSNMGIISGDGVNFYPLNPITRGEAAVILSRIYSMYNGGGR